MKRTFFFLFSLTFLLSTSCKKDDETTTPTSTSSSFNCKIDGVAYNISGVGAYALHNSATDNIYGTEAANNVAKPRTVYIAFAKDKGVGTYTLADANNYALYTDPDGKGYRSDYKNSTGTLTISEKTDKIIKGTFAFTANTLPNGTGKKASVTEGAFEVVYR
jgi:hypothetical protein